MVWGAEAPLGKAIGRPPRVVWGARAPQERQYPKILLPDEAGGPELTADIQMVPNHDENQPRCNNPPITDNQEPITNHSFSALFTHYLYLYDTLAPGGGGAPPGGGSLFLTPCLVDTVYVCYIHAK